MGFCGTGLHIKGGPRDGNVERDHTKSTGHCERTGVGIQLGDGREQDLDTMLSTLFLRCRFDSQTNDSVPRTARSILRGDVVDRISRRLICLHVKETATRPDYPRRQNSVAFRLLQEGHFQDVQTDPAQEGLYLGGSLSITARSNREGAGP